MRSRGIALAASLLGAAGCSAPVVSHDGAADASADSVQVTTAPAPVRGTKLPEFQRLALDNGAVILLARKPDVPLVAMHVMLRGGSITDTPQQAGLAGLTASLLEKGAGERDAVAFVDAVAAVGGSLGASAGLESVQIGAEFLSADAALMIELVADMLKAPRFEQGEFDKLRQRSIDFIKSARDSDPRPLIGIYGSTFLFGDHPYGTPSSGSETTLAALTRDDVARHYADHYGADRLIVSVVGDFDPLEVSAQLRESFGDWRRAAASLPALTSSEPGRGRRVLLVDKPDATQTYFWLGNVGVARSFEGRAPLDIANTLFGGRFTSMLNTALRVESGLTYSARSRLTRPSARGSVAIVSYTATESTEQALDLALDTLTRLRTQPPSPELLASAQAYILGQSPLRLETAAQVAAQLGALTFYGLEREYVDGYAQLVAGATAQDVAGVIDEVYPSADDLVMVMIGKADAIREQVKKYGALTEISITEPAFSP